MDPTLSTAMRKYSLADARLALSALSDLPEISGAITKTVDFKLRIRFPWDRNTEALLKARGQSHEQLQFVRSLATALAVADGSLPVAVVGLVVNERASKLFKSPGDEPGMTALLTVQLAYSAHRSYRADELLTRMQLRLAHERYPQDSLAIDVLPNR